MELDCFPLIKLMVYTNSITSSCAPTVAGGGKVTYTQPSPGCRDQGREITSCLEPRGWQGWGHSRGTAGLPSGRTGLLGRGLLVFRPQVLPEPRSDREPRWMHGVLTASRIHGRGCAHPCRPTVGCAFLMAAISIPTTWSASALHMGGRSEYAHKQGMLLNPHCIDFRLSEKESGLREVRECAQGHTAYELTSCAWNPGLLGSGAHTKQRIFTLTSWAGKFSGREKRRAILQKRSSRMPVLTLGGVSNPT